MAAVTVVLSVIFSLPTLEAEAPTEDTELIAESEPVADILREEPTQSYVDLTQMVVYEVTAYTAGAESTGKTLDHPAYGITASGATVTENHTLACPPEMPFGTRVYIPDLDVGYTCEDRGSAITSGHLDVYIADLTEARAFGRRELEALILPPLSGKETKE